MGISLLIYADEDYYRDTYGGSDIKDSVLLKYLRKASLVINKESFGNTNEYFHNAITSDDESDREYLELIKQCCCDIADVLFDQDTKIAKQENKMSESVDDWSVSYSDISGVREDYELTVTKTVSMYLQDTGLLCRW